MRRAPANLLTNAVRYADPGTVISTIGIDEADRTLIYVENHGPTIDPPHLERLFDRFYRAGSSRQRSSESSGLGLSIGLHRQHASRLRFVTVNDRSNH